MTTYDLLMECRRIGIALRVRGGRLEASPIGSVPGDLKSKLRARKAELIRWLTRDPDAGRYPGGASYYADIDGRLYPCGALPIASDCVIVWRADARGRKRLVRLPTIRRTAARFNQ